MAISLQGAIDLGLKQNLGVLLSNADIQSARGQRWEQLSALLPHVAAGPYIDASKTNLSEVGLSLKIPGLTFPTSVGPFSYFDARVNVTQSLFDWKSINNARAAGQSLKSAEHTYKDARDLVVLAVGYTYLQAIADEARAETAEAQVKTAQAVYSQASDQVSAGTSPAIDGLRAKVELQTRQQQLIQAKNELAIQKLTVARVIGLAPGQEFELTDKSLYQPFEGLTVEAALQRAYAFGLPSSNNTGTRGGILAEGCCGWIFPVTFLERRLRGGRGASLNGDRGVRRARNVVHSDLSGRQRTWRRFAG
jgi:outer membrane protein TolC